MWRYSESLVAGLLAIAFVGGCVSLADSQFGPPRVRYDPEQVCRQHHPELPLEQCLSMISFAQSAGM